MKFQCHDRVRHASSTRRARRQRAVTALSAAAAAAAAAIIVGAPHRADAASSTWNGLAADQLWQTPGNWDGNIVAGSNDGAAGTNTDTATFVTNPPPVIPEDTHVFVAVDANRNIGSITFDSTTLSFRLGATTANTGNTLYLSGGGVMLKPNNGSTFAGDVYAPIEFTGSTYTFRHLNAGSSLRPLGNVYARAGGGTTLTLDGTHGSGGGSSAEVNGGLKDNPAGGVLTVVKQGPGAWEVNANGGDNANTYTGDTIINGGVLRASTATGYNGQGGFSPFSHYIVNGPVAGDTTVNTGGTLRNSVIGTTIGKLTVNFGGQVTVSTGAATLLNVKTNSGPAITLNLANNTHSNNITFNLPFGLTGTEPLHGGLVMTATPGATGTGPVSIGNSGGFFNLGDVTRILEIGQGTGIDTSQNPPVPSNYDARIQGQINGAAGFIKKGPGTLRFSGPATSPMTGNIEIQQGTFNPSVANLFDNAPTLLVSGGTLRLQSGHTQTFGAVTVTRGEMTGGDNNATVAAPSFNFNVDGADTARADVVLANAGGATGLTKAGTGTATVEISPTYTGPTNVNAGALAFAAHFTPAGAVNVTGGTLKISASDTEPNRVLRADSFAITGDGRIDLTRNKLITAVAPGTYTGDPGIGTYSGVQGEVQRAYNFGAWDQPGLTTSQERAGQNAGVFSGTETIGVATAEQVLFIGPADTAIFAGQTVTGATTIAMYTYAGDMNFDGLVDGADYGIIDNSVQFPGTTGYALGDLNYDGVIDGADYGIIDNTVQLQGAPFSGVVFGASAPSAGLGGVTAVPEPSACGFAILAASAMLARRRRRQA